MILFKKVSSYYRDAQWSERDPQIVALHTLLQTLIEQKLKPIIIITPQNPDIILNIDVDSALKAKIQKLEKDLTNTFPALSFISKYNAYPSEDFLDHCHLTPDGVARFSKELSGIVQSL